MTAQHKILYKRLIEVPDGVREAVCTEHVLGAPLRAVAKKHGLTLGLALKVWNKFKASEPCQDLAVYKEKLRQKAFVAIDDGLDCKDDMYKRANIGIQVAKGTGDLQPDGVIVNINNMLAQIPPEWADRYLSTDRAIQIVETREGLRLKTAKDTEETR